MAKLTNILQQRFRKKEKSKMTELAEKTQEGNLTVFSGVFGLSRVGEQEKEELANLLERFSTDENADHSEDLTRLIAITSEVKAINNQAAILHGERIKNAQEILKKYRDGAFTSWLLTTYGNRQTPYNFLQYYEFHNKIPQTLHTQLESMPRQAIYTLASREGELSQKEEIVRNYSGETKAQMITMIRSLFPLGEQDKRRENVGQSTIRSLQNLLSSFQAKPKFTPTQKEKVRELIDSLVECLQD